MTKELYLGIDGGQSHTAAVIADADGRVRGRGRGGASNHAERPGGRERLRAAIETSVGAALHQAGALALDQTEFAAAHCAMTGSADFKEEIISGVLRARSLIVGHDSPAALAGALGGADGVVVIAGTGSVAYGERADGESLRVGGWGYLFGDEGAGFWIAAEAVRAAMRLVDRLGAETALHNSALDHFGVRTIERLEQAVYSEAITRDQLAKFSVVVHDAAKTGDAVARDIIERGATSLARLAARCIEGLRFEAEDDPPVAPVGGVFRGELMREAFERELMKLSPAARVVDPLFDPAIGALLLAYRRSPEHTAKREIVLENLKREANG